MSNISNYIKNIMLSDVKIISPFKYKIERNSIDGNKLSNYNNKYLNNFIDVITKNIPNDNLKLFYSNIDDLEIIKLNGLKYNKKNTHSLYDTKNNCIKTTSLNDSMALYHELLHMCSSIYKETENKYYSFTGFSYRSHQINKIGDGLNEGYTEFLKNRYFTDDFFRVYNEKHKTDYRNYSKDNSYILEEKISKYLEKIIGKEKMENLYFNANLKGLIEELKKYSTEENIVKFIRKVDILWDYFEWKEFDYSKEDRIQKYFVDVYEFLIECYIKKLMANSDIDNEQIITETSKYINELLNETYKILNIHYGNRGFFVDYISYEKVISKVWKNKNSNNINILNQNNNQKIIKKSINL